MAKREHKRVTIADVARRAGVAPSTVSRAFARPGHVASETAERVYRAAEDLGYRQAPVRHADRREPRSLLGIVVADVMNPVFAAIVKGAHARAEREGYALVLVDSEESRAAERTTLERMATMVDGLILAGSRMSDTAVRHFAHVLPTVVVNRRVPGVSSVIADSPSGLREALDHLHGLGHRDVGYVSGPPDSWEEGIRWRAVADYCRRAGLQCHRLMGGVPTLAGGHLGFRSWADAPTSAVIVYNDLMAIGFMQEARRHATSVPGDVSVVGFDDIPFSGLVQGGLTTVTTDFPLQGSAAVGMVLEASRRRVVHPPLRSVLTPTRLVVRGSTGPASEAPCKRLQELD